MRSTPICARCRRSPTASTATRCRSPSTSAFRCAAGTRCSSRRARSQPDPKRSDEFNRGAYLVEGLGHCGACHTPFNAFGASKADQYPARQPDRQLDRAQHHQRHAVRPRQMVGRRHRAISEDRPDPLQPRQRADEGRDREFDLEDAGCRSQGDRGLSEGARRGRLAGAGAAGCVRSAHAGRARRSSPTPAPPVIRAAAPASSTCSRNSPATSIATQDDPASLIRIVIAGGRAAATDERPTSPAMPSLGYRLERRRGGRGRDLCPQ